MSVRLHHLQHRIDVANVGYTGIGIGRRAGRIELASDNLIRVLGTDDFGG